MPLMYHIYQSGAFVWFLWVCEFVLFTSKAIYRNVIWKSEVGIVPAPNIESFLQGPWVVPQDYMLKGLAHTRIKFTLYVAVRVDWDHPTLSSGCTCIKNVKLRKRYMCIDIYIHIDEFNNIVLMVWLTAKSTSNTLYGYSSYYIWHILLVTLSQKTGKRVDERSCHDVS